MIALAIRYWWAFVLAGLVALLGLQTVRLSSAKQDIAQMELEAAQAQQRAEQQARAEEARRQTKIDEVTQDAQKKLDAAKVEVDSANAASDRLRASIAAATSRARKDTCSTATSVPAGDPIGVLADVLVRVDQRAGILAEYADRARIAGNACVASYEALGK